MVLMDRNTQTIVVQGYGVVFDCRFQIYDSFMCYLLRISHPENKAYVNFTHLFCA